MTPDDQREMEQALKARSDEVTDRWYRTIQGTSFSARRPAEVRRRLRYLTDEAVDVLVGQQFERERAEAIGAAIAALHYIQPAALGGTQEVLGGGLAAALTAEQLAGAQQRLGLLLGSVAAGYCAESRMMILLEQEEIRRALFDARLEAEEARVAAEAALRARNGFLSALSHDLRTPITTVKGRADFKRPTSAPWLPPSWTSIGPSRRAITSP